MSGKKRGLGRGLAALINEDLSIENEGDLIKDVDIGLIVPNKNQPRRSFDEEKLKELSKSIKVNGLIQPIIIRKTGKKYELIAGERRLRAAKLAGFKEIPSIVRDIDEARSSKFAVIENIQRENLNPVEEGQAYRMLIDKYKLSQDELASQVGKSRSYISNAMRILNLDGEILELIEEGKLSPGHAKVLLSIKSDKVQRELAQEIIEKDLSVRETESLLAEISKGEKPKKIPSRKRKKPSNVIAVEESLMSSLGTKVNLKTGKKKGKIEIEYYGLEDLERLIEILTR